MACPQDAPLMSPLSLSVISSSATSLVTIPVEASARGHVAPLPVLSELHEVCSVQYVACTPDQTKASQIQHVSLHALHNALWLAMQPAELALLLLCMPCMLWIGSCMVACQAHSNLHHQNNTDQSVDGSYTRVCCIAGRAGLKGQPYSKCCGVCGRFMCKAAFAV